MSVFDGVESSDLVARYYDLIQKYATLASELAVKLEKFGKMRDELQKLTLEFSDRKINVEDPQELVKWMEQQLEKIPK